MAILPDATTVSTAEGAGALFLTDPARIDPSRFPETRLPAGPLPRDLQTRLRLSHLTRSRFAHLEWIRQDLFHSKGSVIRADLFESFEFSSA